MMQFAGLFFQVILKLLPLLYQFRIIREESKLRELQARFETAIRQAEADRNDAIRLREGHAAAQDRLRARWEAINQGKPDPAEAPVEAPVALSVTGTPLANKPFVVHISRPVEGAFLYADAWILCGVSGRTDVEITLNTGGKRRLRLVIGARDVAELEIEVQKA